MLRKIIFLIAVMLIHVSLHAGRWIRYNIAGYDPVRPKKVIVMADDNCSAFAWRIKNASNAVVLNGTLGASAAGTGNFMPKAFNYEITFTSLETLGTYTLEVDNIGTASIKIACRPYQPFLSQVLRTIRVRRSGSNDALDHAYSHGGDVSCPIYRRNGTNNGSWSVASPAKSMNMLGGFYDAGDYIKFTTTNAYLTYFMLRSYETAPELFDGVKLYSTTSLDDLLDECKWGLDFLLKTMPADGSEFIIQTGGSADHNQWPARLPENDNLNGSRECYSAFSPTQMGLTAATLALGSKIFNAKGLTTTATNYRNKAIQIYAAAKAANPANGGNANNAWWQGGFEVYYADNTYKDNMELAAIELYGLTNTASYLTDAQDYGNAAGSAYWSSWGNLNLTAHSRLYPHYNGIQNLITNDLTYFAGISNTANNRWKLPHNSVWGSLYSQFGVAHGALQYKMASASTAYDNFGYDVIDYTFGRNSWGLGFIATQTIPNTITSSYATIYKLTGKFPYGEIAEGPAPAADHGSNTAYFSPAHNPNLWHKDFNTANFTFFEQPGDFVCMETTICGLADGLFLLTLASKSFCSTPLPVDLLSFDANYNNEKVTLQWSTAQETNSDYFSIERSSDGINFSSIATVDAAGTSTEVKSYSYIDASPLQGLSYYRLKQYDINGNSYDGTVVSVNNVLSVNYSIYPNPFNSQLSVTIDYFNGKEVNLKLMDISGKVLMEETGVFNSIDLYTKHLPLGLYFMKIIHNNSTYSIKLLKNDDHE